MIACSLKRTKLKEIAHINVNFVVYNSKENIMEIDQWQLE